MTKPRGRESVVAEIIEAATRLLAERGPSAVSLREVAAAANVNTGLIHHYIGNKHDLITTVLEHGATRGFDGLDNTELTQTVFPVGDAEPTETTKAMMVQLRTALAGVNLLEHQPRFPLAEDLYRRTAPNTTREDARVRTSFLIAAVTGWLVVGPMLLSVLEADGIDADTVARLLAEVVTDTMKVPPSPTDAATTPRRAPKRHESETD